ncbi:unnamed protein product, partial [Adineta steineri]
MALLPSTFEILPDEILMIIFRYSDNVTSVFHMFCSLNQRLNQILVDRRLHLFTDFLRINIRQLTLNYYYDTPLIHTLSQELYSLQGNNHIHQIDQCFQRLVSFHIEEKSRQLEDQFRSDRQQFRSIRYNLADEEIHCRDAALREAFNNLESHSHNSQYLQQVVDLVVGTGARLECSDNHLDGYNLAKALNEYLLSHLYTIGYPNGLCLHSILRLFKALIVSNPNLVYNEDCVRNSVYPMYYFLVYAVFRLQDFYRNLRPMAISMQKYDTILELLLFTIQYLKEVSDEELWIKNCLLNSLQVVTSNENDEINRKETRVNDYSNYMLHDGLKNLIVTDRIDIIQYVFRQNNFMQSFLTRSDHSHKLIDTILGRQSSRKIFQHFLEEKPPESWLTSTKLLFILLDKKECKWIKKLLRLDSRLIHQVDEDGNDPLLYVCLKVNGCRHRLIEYLIGMGCDIHKRNVH